MNDPPLFLADVMLGSLAKWLRILGFDTEYDNGISDDRLIRRALAEGRVLLTRDRRLTQRKLLRGKCLLIREDDLKDQILQVLHTQGEFLNRSLILSRCLNCNHPLVPASRGSVAGQVPPYVYSTRQTFKRCPRCAKIYWKGTHREHILEKLLEIADSRFSEGIHGRTTGEI